MKGGNLMANNSIGFNKMYNTVTKNIEKNNSKYKAIKFEMKDAPTPAEYQVMNPEFANAIKASVAPQIKKTGSKYKAIKLEMKDVPTPAEYQVMNPEFANTIKASDIR